MKILLSCSMTFYCLISEYFHIEYWVSISSTLIAVHFPFFVVSCCLQMHDPLLKK